MGAGGTEALKEREPSLLLNLPLPRGLQQCEVSPWTRWGHPALAGLPLPLVEPFQKQRAPWDGTDLPAGPHAACWADPQPSRES